MSKFSIGRRGFIATGTGWLAAQSLGLGQTTSDLKTISIFHTTDLHGHIVPTQTYTGTPDVGGFARCATQLREWRRENPDSLVLDIGDVYQGTAESLNNRGKLMLELFTRLGYDAWTLGNHDFDWGPEILEANLAASKQPVLTGNLDRAGKPAAGSGAAWDIVKPWMMKEVAGFRIALVGLITPGLPYWLSPETMGGVACADPSISLAKSIAEARAAKADAIVVMGHMGWRNDDDFANPLRAMLKGDSGVDILLAGHTHQDKPSWEIGQTLCTQASYYGIHCGRVDLTFDVNSRKLVRKNVATKLMDHSVAMDAATMEYADPELKKANEQLARKIGRVTNVIGGSGRNSRLATLFCEFFSEALQRNKTPVDGVFHGTFNTGDLPVGDVTVADCWKMLPYENLLTVVKLSAKDLIEIVKEDMTERMSDRTLWPFDLRFGAGGEVGRFVLKDRAVGADESFTIGLNSYDAQSGGKKLMRLREIVSRPEAARTTIPIDTRGALIEGILNRHEIS